MIRSVSGAYAPRVIALCGVLLLTACGGMGPSSSRDVPPPAIDLHLSSKAISEAHAKRSRGERVWCVPFARTMSGIDLRGDAKLWWSAASGVYERGPEPRVGAVMVFSGSRALSRGHLAVVSEIVSDREILIDHANWHRNKVSLKMRVVDVSAEGDWSAVKLESFSGNLGRVNPVSGFIYPQRVSSTPI